MQVPWYTPVFLSVDYDTDIERIAVERQMERR
jgi:hypothetical protein